MRIETARVSYQDVAAMQELHRQEMNCQLIYDSQIARGLTDPYLVLVDGRVAGYGAATNHYDKGRLVEFYTLPQLREHALPMFRELLGASAATHIGAQTNSPLLLMMLYDCAENIIVEKVLFHDAFTSRLSSADGVFRKAESHWCIEANGEVVASGGFLCHYNPPYGDVFMETVEAKRRNGFGSYLVQELKRVCYEAGRKPAARCDVENAASRRTLEKAGLLPCGRYLVGEVPVS